MDDATRRRRALGVFDGPAHGARAPELRSGIRSGSKTAALSGARTIGLGVVLALVSAAYLAGGLVMPANVFDEGLVTLAGQRVLNGDVPYRGFWTVYAPGQFYSLALVFELFGASLLTARLWDVAVRAALVVPFVAISYVALPAFIGAPAASTAWFRPCALAVDRGGCAGVPSDQADAVEFVRRRVDPHQPIFVANTRNDRMLGNDMMFYFLADRPSATRYHHLEPGITTTPAAQAEIVAELERGDVTHVVLFDGFDDKPNWHRVDAEVGSTLLDEFIRARYQPTATFGRYSVSERS